LKILLQKNQLNILTIKIDMIKKEKKVDA